MLTNSLCFVTDNMHAKRYFFHSNCTSIQMVFFQFYELNLFICNLSGSLFCHRDTELVKPYSFNVLNSCWYLYVPGMMTLALELSHHVILTASLWGSDLICSVDVTSRFCDCSLSIFILEPLRSPQPCYIQLFWSLTSVLGVQTGRADK